MVLERIRRFKAKNEWIGMAGSKARKERLAKEDSERTVNTSRARKNRRGRTTGKEYWNPMTGKYQSSPVKAPVTKDHLGRDPEVGAAKRNKVRKNPVSDETLKTVKTTVAKEKAEKAKKLKIGQELAAQFKKDDDEIAAAYKNKKDSKKLEKPKETEADARAKWEKKTRNSPARRSGAWDADELWEKQKKHRKWESDRKEGKLKREKFDPRKPRGYKRKLVQKTPAELAAERRKRQLKNAQKDNTSKKSDINKKKEAVFNLQKGRYEVL